MAERIVPGPVRDMFLNQLDTTDGKVHVVQVIDIKKIGASNGGRTPACRLHLVSGCRVLAPPLADKVGDPRTTDDLDPSNAPTVERQVVIPSPPMTISNANINMQQNQLSKNNPHLARKHSLRKSCPRLTSKFCCRLMRHPSSQSKSRSKRLFPQDQPSRSDFSRFPFLSFCASPYHSQVVTKRMMRPGSERESAELEPEPAPSST
eukprot:1917883-Rhodomonas_salina.1